MVLLLIVELYRGKNYGHDSMVELGRLKLLLGWMDARYSLVKGRSPAHPDFVIFSELLPRAGHRMRDCLISGG